MATPQVIAFDLYDTLVRIDNPTHPFLAIFEQCKEALGLTRKEFLYRVLTQEIPSLINTFPPAFAEAYEKHLPMIEEEIASVTLFEETKEVIAKLSSAYPLVLISNLATPYKRPFRDSGLIDFFQKVCFSCELGMKKPEPAIFREVEKWSGVSGRQILMVGDNPISDGKGAVALGWRYLRINRGQEFAGAHQIHTLRALKERYNPSRDFEP